MASLYSLVFVIVGIATFAGIAADTNAPVGTNSLAGTNSATGTNAVTQAAEPGGFSLDSLKSLKPEQYGYIAVGVVGLAVVISLLMKLFRPRKPLSSSIPDMSGDPGAPAVVAKGAKTPAHCNVVSVMPGQRKLWRFAAAGRGRMNLTQEYTELPEENMPAKVVGKGWGDLFNPRLNIAWLPSDKVFLRVAEFPGGDADELRSMVELQLEKLSPLPLTQIVWTIQTLPEGSASDGMVPVVLIIASRYEVEKHLGQLEQTGFQADRLELPELHQFLAAHKPDDGVWFIPRGNEDSPSILIAWWYGGTLKNLTIANLTEPTKWAKELGDQLAQVAWSGELEGWYSGEPHFHLLADFAAADDWKPVLEKVTGEPVTVDEPLNDVALAGINAQKAAAGEELANLMPADIVETYRQRFIDSIWMRGLGTIVMVYLFGILLYFLALVLLHVMLLLVLLLGDVLGRFRRRVGACFPLGVQVPSACHFCFTVLQCTI